MARVIPAGRGRYRDTLAWVIIVAIAVGVGWFYLHDQRSRKAVPQEFPANPAFGVARRRLDALPVKGWDRFHDFSRARFGEPWSDDVNVEFGHNGCNTRDDILRRDLADLQLRSGTCFAQRGVLHDPYTGATVVFVRGPDSSPVVQIDHVVSLSDAWYKGARFWDDQRRRDFANDPRNLLAVAGQANFDKAFRDAASWLPPNAAFRCAFVARQVEVKTDYQLSVSAKEKDAMRRVLQYC
ncbi:MAG: HNH endonuclease family protein [Mycobacterium sp.]|uniref:HNH endonuclease family protein n=1 Tax=Mycobacterium sp. TaxID=1785 RepID=UPI003C34B3D5